MYQVQIRSNVEAQRGLDPSTWYWYSNVWCNENRTKLISVLLLWLVRFLIHQTLATAHMNSMEISLIWFNDNIFIKNEYSKNMVRNFKQKLKTELVKRISRISPLSGTILQWCTECSWQQLIVPSMWFWSVSWSTNCPVYFSLFFGRP